MNNLRDKKQCNLCGSDEYEVIHYYPEGYYNHGNFITHSWDGGLDMDLTIVKCKSCGLVYQNPCFNSAGMEYLYPVSIIPDKLDYRSLTGNHKFNPILDIIGRYYPAPEKDKPVMADIGTRYGVLPEILSQKGFNAFGIEYNEKCVSSAINSGFGRIYQGTIDNLEDICKKLSLNSINLVVMIDVIEHLLDPLSDFKKIAGLQGKGDRMMITTMNINSPGYKLFGADWYYIHAQHTYYFNEKTIRQLFDRVGYETEQVFQVKILNNLTILPAELVKFIKHKMERIKYRKDKQLPGKLWFATNRPSLFDLFTVVVKKR